MKKGLLFDLDGTLVDTAEDIRCAINHVMRLTYNREITKDECLRVVGRGLRNAMKGALALSGAHYPDDEINILYSELISYYSSHPSDHSHPYPGITEFLKLMSERGYALGILSNKSDILVQEIVKKLFGDINFSFVSGFCDKIPLKPDRGGVLAFAQCAHVNLEDITYVGDSEVDAETIKAAYPVKGVLVSWGFRPRCELERLLDDNIKLIDNIKELGNVIN